MITDYGIKAMLTQMLAAPPPQNSLMRLGFRFSSELMEGKSEDLSFLGSIGVISEWGANGRNASQPREYDFALKNKKFSGGVQFPYSLVKTDRTGTVAQRLSDLPVRERHFWEAQFATLINNAETDTNTVDGVSFFNNSHAAYSSFDNLIGAQSATAGAPTPQEAADAIFDCYVKLLSFKDDNSEPANEGMTELMVVAGTDIGASVMQAVMQDQLDTGAGTIDNPLNGLRSAGITITPIISSRISTSGKLSAFNSTSTSMELGDGETVTAGAKPLLLMENENLREISNKGLQDTSEFRHDTDLVETALKIVGNVGYGRPWEAVRYNFN